MLTYVCLGTDDSAAAWDFYTAVLAPLGYVKLEDNGGFGPPGGPTYLWVGKPFDGGRASFGNGTMVCLNAPSRAAVDAFHAACLAHGGTDEGPPGIRRYAPDWYAAYARDPDGNKLSAVFRG
jgi:catechol 2,3-dioxygenase-like lactoylglutathione lyase family enzyme